MDIEGARVAGYAHGQQWARLGLSYQSPAQVRADIDRALRESRPVESRHNGRKGEEIREYEQAFRWGVHSVVGFSPGQRVRYAPTEDMDPEELALAGSLGTICPWEPAICSDGVAFQLVKWDWNHLETECEIALMVAV